MYRLGRPAPRGSARRGDGEGRAQPPRPAPRSQCSAGRGAGQDRQGRSVRRGEGPARATWRPSKPRLFSAPLPPLLQRLLRRGEARLRKRAAQPGRQSGAPANGALGALVFAWREVLSESTPTDVAAGLQEAGKGVRAWAQGLNVNGDSGGGRGEGSGAAGRALWGPGGRSWFSGVDGDDLAAAAADQHHPVQVLGEDLKELHV